MHGGAIIMSDITMCDGKGCDNKEECYRYTAPKCPYRQSFFVYTPLQMIGEDQSCDEYWPNQRGCATKERLGL